MITTANRRGVLPRFRLPEDNTLLPACLVLMFERGYNGEMAISLGLAMAAMSMSVRVGVNLDEGPSQPLYDRLGLG